MKAAVKAGYWNLFSFNPALKAEGKNPFTLTSKAGDGSYQSFLNNETRYSSLTRKFPERAKILFDRNEQAAKARFVHLQKLVDFNENAPLRGRDSFWGAFFGMKLCCYFND